MPGAASSPTPNRGSVPRPHSPASSPASTSMGPRPATVTVTVRRRQPAVTVSPRRRRRRQETSGSARAESVSSGRAGLKQAQFPCFRRAQFAPKLLGGVDPGRIGNGAPGHHDLKTRRRVAIMMIEARAPSLRLARVHCPSHSLSCQWQAPAPGPIRGL
jgi:hypothetical protein